LAGEKVSVRLEGDILPECAIAGGAGPGGANLALALDIGSMAGAGRSEYGFTVNCNAPFAYRLEAQYGALTQAGAKPGDGGFAAVLPYRVAVHIPTQRGAIDDICLGESLRAGRVTCPFSTSGNDVALGSAARLTITWEPQGRPPPAGEYVERLTITVAMSL
jgi:hypothetical protein